MRLSTHTDYALRVLMYLGVRGEGKPLPTIGDIADSYGISRNHLMKVVQRLGQEGYVETLRGKGGGLRLGQPADRVRLGTVVRLLEARREPLVECFDRDSNTCIIGRPCRLRPILAEAEDAFMAALDRYTLADLLAPRADLADLLGVA